MKRAAAIALGLLLVAGTAWALEETWSTSKNANSKYIRNLPAPTAATNPVRLQDVFTSGANGVAPASGGGSTNFLRADGTWAAPPGGGADALGHYLVARAANAPANAVNLGIFLSGVLQHTVSAGVSSPSIFAAGSGRVPFGSGVDGGLTDSANLTFGSGTLTVTGTTPLVFGGGATGAKMSIRDPDDTANLAQTILYPAAGTNVTPTVSVVPRGTGFSSTIRSEVAVYNTDAVADAANYELLTIRARGTSGFRIATGEAGTGTLYPLELSAGGASATPVNANQILLNTDGTVTLSSLGTGVVVATSGELGIGVAGTDYQAPGNYITSLTGPVTASGPGAAATTITANAIGNAELRDSGALSVIGRSVNTGGDPADISVSAGSGLALRESGSTLGFGTLGALAVPALDAHFWTDRAESTLANEVNLGALTTGLLKHTVSGGVSTPATAVAGTDYETPITFSTGLTDAANTVTANLSTGVSGGQTVVGGTGSAESLTYSSTTHGTKGTHIWGSTSGMVYNEATKQFVIGTAAPATDAAMEVLKTQNGGTYFAFVNESTGTAAYTAFQLGQSANLLSGASFGMYLFSSGSTFGTPYNPNNGLIQLAAGGGNLVIWNQQSTGDIVFYTKATFPNPPERMRITTDGVVSINDLNAGGMITTNTSGVLSEHPLVDYDTGDDQLWIGAGAEFAHYNTGSPTGSYERVRGDWSGNVWTLASEASGGTVRPMVFDAGTANLTLEGATIAVTATSAVNVTSSGGATSTWDGNGSNNLSLSNWGGLSGSASTSVAFNTGEGSITVALGDNTIDSFASPVISSAGATQYNGFRHTGSATISASGTLTVPFASAKFQAGTFSQSGAGTATVDLPATVWIDGPPTAGTDTTFTNNYALFVDSGVARFDGGSSGGVTGVFELPADATGNTSAATGRIPVIVTGVGLKYIRYYND